MPDNDNLPEIYRQPAAQVDMRDRRTDSWTDVLQPVIDLVNFIGPAATEFVPKGLNNEGKLAAAVLYSRELGLPPMTGLSSVHVINGRAGISAETMRALIQQAGHQIRVTEMTDSRCIIKGRRRDEDEWVTTSYTMNEADRSGDSKKNPNYRTRPAEMLLARASTRLARMAFADVIKGLTSTEELQDLAYAEQVPPADAPAIAAADSTQTTVKRQPAKRRTRKPAEPQGPAPERQHAPLPAPRGAAGQAPAPDVPPVGESGVPELVTSPVGTLPAGVDENGVVDGDIVVEDSPRPAARHDVQQIQMHLKRLGAEERDERLMWVGIIAGHQIDSTTDLTAEEADKVIKELGRLRDHASLVARCNELGDDD